MSNDHWLNYLVSEDVVLARSRVSGEWGIRLEQTAGAYFHSVGEGAAYVQIEGGSDIELGPGDIVVFPQGSSHLLRGSPTSKVVPLSQFIQDSETRSSNASNATTLLCGSFGIARYMNMPAIKSLPSVMHLKVQSDGPNTAFVDTVKHLLSTLFIYILRQWSETQPNLANTWFSALQNQHVAKALECIHKQPAENWTIETLAQVAGLSRSLFAKQFQESVGESPYVYLTRWRIGIAAQLLSQTDISVGEVAKKTGYNSGYSFVRAFKQVLGKTPKQHRSSRQSINGSPVNSCGLTGQLLSHY
jgi:AraC-like DNA-binding protein